MLRQVPATAVLLAVGVGLALVALEHWRVGSTVVGAGVLLGALLRLALPDRAAGALAVRSRTVDTVVLLVLGVGVVVLAGTVPRPA